MLVQPSGLSAVTKRQVTNSNFEVSSRCPHKASRSMDDEANELEEGELSASDDEKTTTYTPLQRPLNYSASQPNSRFSAIPLDDTESEPSEASSSDSDSDSAVKKKKPKVKPPKRLKGKRPDPFPKRKKYDIWSTRAQEDVLSETLNCCDVSIKDRSRDVESYDYTASPFYNKNNKRSRDDRNNPGFKQKQRSKSKDSKGPARTILDLVVNGESSNEDVAKDIATKLYEEKDELILKAVNALGQEKCFSIFKETKRIEEEGGMLILNQSRRRTPGGVFLFLVRHDNDITKEQLDLIFGDDKDRFRKAVRSNKKKKLQQLKTDIVSSKTKFLPDLLNRAEQLANNGNRARKQTEAEEKDVKNPPPSPETDGHSGDGMDLPKIITMESPLLPEGRKVATYDDDFLDIECSEMDLF